MRIQPNRSTRYPKKGYRTSRSINPPRMPRQRSRGVAQRKKLTIGTPQIISIIVVLLIVSVSIGILLTQEDAEKQDFTLHSIDHGVFQLSDFRSKVVLLDFGGAECVSCDKVLQIMKELYPEMSERGAIFISINVFPSETEDDLKDWREENNIPIENWYIAKDTDNLVEKYNAYYIPRLLIIDKDGYISYEHTGGISKKELHNELNDTIKGRNSAIGVRQYGIYSLAFLAGVAMFFSPCAFPLLPGYMMTYFKIKEKKSRIRYLGYKNALVFGTIAAAGVLTIIIFYGLLFAIASEIIGDINWSYFTFIVLVFLFIFGISMLLDIRYDRILNPIRGLKNVSLVIIGKIYIGKLVKRFETFIGNIAKSNFSFQKAKKNGQLAIYSYGIGYGGVAAGCHAPIFLALFIVALGKGFTQAFLMFIFFGLGMGSIMIIVTLLLATAKSRAIDWLIINTVVINKMTGVTLILTAIIMLIITVS